ncbi:MAG: hypothetical protein PHW76_04010, partial [Alphaproteobacteria bacterium]|nr:hypothetical protein [Alphaproteobacteria bacterium]
MSGFFSGHAQDSVMHGEFMGFALDDESLTSLRGWAERQGYPQGVVQQGDLEFFSKLLEKASPPKIAIVDIDSLADPIAATGRIVNLCGSECRLVLIGA